MHKGYIIILTLLLSVGLVIGQDYVGSDQCVTCHGPTIDATGAGYDIYGEFLKTGHPYKLNPVDGAAPTYPANTSPGVIPPEGHAWTDFDFVIGGYGWKSRYVDSLGYIFTGDELSTTTGDSVAQYNLETGGWVTYHKGELKAYNYGCFKCHTTGASPDGSYNQYTPGLGTFAEPGIGCEGCHGPGGDHVGNPGGVSPPITGDSLAFDHCGECHQRDSKTNEIPVSGGYIRHHEQFNEMKASAHADGKGFDLTCADCHLTHVALHYPAAAGEGLSGLVAECEDCHGNKKAIVNETVEHNNDCEICHMPPASKSAVGIVEGNGRRGDVSTHIWAINTDPVTYTTMMNDSLVELNADGHAAVTLDFTCLRSGCHSTQDVAWASGHAKGIHQGQNYYLGVYFDPTGATDDGCVDCHSATITSWEGTGHSTAQAGGSVSPGFGYSCLQCHNTGWDTTLVNWGADEFVQEEVSNGFTITDSANWNRVENVQCEACHGPVGTPDSTVDLAHMSREADLSADLCGACHEGEHHPTFADWEESAHAGSKDALSFIKFNPSCAGCHTAEGFLQYLDQPLFSEPNVVAPGEAGHDITCAACHNPHSAQYAGQLRDDPVQICDRCHNPEYNPDSPTPDDPDISLHHTTAFMLDGKGGWEYGQSIQNSVHTVIATERCINCHVFMIPFADPIPAYTGHAFEPRVEACAQDGCHGANYYTEVDTSDHLNRFNLRGIQSEIDTLLNELDAELAAATGADSTTDAFKQAKFNWEFVHAGGSRGVHNFKYAKGLLEASISDFTPSGIESVNEVGLPLSYKLDQNFPNPFNPTTEIGFSIKKPGRVVLKVYDMLGREVMTLVDREMPAGTYKTRLDGKDLATGIYLYRIHSGEFSAIRKLVLLK